MLWTKLLILAAMILIVYALGSAAFFIVKGDVKDKNKTALALTWRIGLSLALFLFLFFAFSQGWIAPHGIGR